MPAGRWPIFIVLAASAAVYGDRLPIRAYTTADGLAQNTVHSILRDSNGFVLFGTSEGISRYDGYQFQSYEEPKRTKQRRVRKLLETHNGEFWAGTEDGICRFFPGHSDDKPLFNCLGPAIDI